MKQGTNTCFGDCYYGHLSSMPRFKCGKGAKYPTLQEHELNCAMVELADGSAYCPNPYCPGPKEMKPMGFSIDTTKVVASFGDVNYLEYGGQLLVPDADGDLYLEVIEPPCDDECEAGDWKSSARWTIYRVEPEQKKLVEVDRQVYLVCVRYQPDWPHPAASYDEWFHKDLDKVADFIGATMQDIRDELCSDDPKERAAAYIDMASYWGWHEFDHYPLQLTQHEVHERYGLLDCKCELCHALNRKTELCEIDKLDDEEIAELAKLNARIAELMTVCEQPSK